MKTIRIIVVLVLAVNSVILINACKKDKEETDFDTQTSQDNSLAESTFNDVNNIANEAIARGDSGLSTYRMGSGQNTLLSNCATVTRIPDSTGSGGSITVDFGSANCQCVDNRFRRGIINITYTGMYRDSGTVITTTFTNYFVGREVAHMFQVTGTKTVTNLGTNGNGNYNYNINVDGHLINSTGGTMNWTSNRNREWVAGYSTVYNWVDDEYLVTGSASGLNFDGTSYTVNITTPLRIKLSCWYIVEGKFDLTPSGKATRTFDYGDGTCDNNATLSVNGTTFPITLR
jgi:hypothetical protein